MSIRVHTLKDKSTVHHRKKNESRRYISQGVIRRSRKVSKRGIFEKLRSVAVERFRSTLMRLKLGPGKTAGGKGKTAGGKSTTSMRQRRVQLFSTA